MLSLWGLAACVDPGSGTVPSGTLPVDTAANVDPGVPVEVRSGKPVTCADPGRRDVTKVETHELRAEADKKAWFWGGGVVAGDFDGDGPVDLLLPGFWEAMLYRGVGDGTFVEVSEELPPNLAGGAGGAAADYDGDGDLDILMTRFLASDVLLRNDDGVFVDVSAEAGITQDQARTVSASWGDMDRDGDLDLFVGGYGYIDESGEDPEHDDFLPAEPSYLYENLGDGTFRDVSDRLPKEAHDGYTFAGGWFDLDHDGWLDLYIVNDFGQSYPNRLLWNRDGTLELDRNAHGLDVAITGMGLGIGDIDGDGREDMLMTAWGFNALLKSGAGDAWYDYADLLGVHGDLSRAQKIGWGAEFVDMDLDGDLDAPVAYGFLDSRYQASDRQPDALLIQLEDGTFEDRGREWVMNHPTMGRGFVAQDLNDDGYPDLVRRDVGGPTLVSLSHCGSGAWLRIRLHDEAPNRHAIGARVRVRAGDRSWSNVVRAGGTNHASSGPPEVHFGLGELAEVGIVEITWPDGEVSRITDVGTRRILDITRADR